MRFWRKSSFSDLKIVTEVYLWKSRKIFHWKLLLPALFECNANCSRKLKLTNIFDKSESFSILDLVQQRPLLHQPKRKHNSRSEKTHSVALIQLNGACLRTRLTGRQPGPPDQLMLITSCWRRTPNNAIHLQKRNITPTYWSLWHRRRLRRKEYNEIRNGCF